MSYITQSGRFCDIIVLGVYVSTEDKTDDLKDSFCEELEFVFNKFRKCHLKILLEYLKEHIFKARTCNESSYKIS
jgi:hypothetical protein